MLIGEKKKVDLLLSIFIFLILYDPPIFPNFSFDLLLCVFSIIYIVLHIKDVLIIRSNNPALYFAFFSLYGLLVIILNSLIRGNDFNEVYWSSIVNLLTFFVYNISYATFIVLYCQNKEYDIDVVLNSVILAGLVQSLFVIAAMISPSIKEVLTNIMSANLSESNSKISFYLTDSSSKRNYGFADNLYDMFGFTSSIIFVVAFNKGLYGRKFYLICSVFLLIMSFINTRTGLFLAVFGLIMSLFVYTKKTNQIRDLSKLIAIIIIGAIGVVILFNRISALLPNTYQWLVDGITSTVNYFLYGETSDYYIQATNFWFLPENIFSLFFGTGATPKDLISVGSDVGYINQIWRYGLVGLFYELIIVINFVRSAYINSISSRDKCILTYIICSLLIYLIKLDVFKACSGMYFVSILISSFYAISNNEYLSDNRC